MSTPVASNLAPKGGNSFFILEDIYMKGGLQVRANLAARDTIPISNLKVGALVLCLDTGLCWQVDTITLPSLQNPTVTPSATWKQFSLGGGGSGGIGQRTVFVHTLAQLPSTSSIPVELPFGKSALILNLSVSRVCKISVYGTADKSETNPYMFLADTSHLTDDGSTKLSDGTTLRSRRYSIFANMEQPAQSKTYMTVENVDGVEGSVVVTITYLSLEQ